MRTGLGILAAVAALSLTGCDGNENDGPGGTEADLMALVMAEAACTQDADCCVVIDGCMATAYVVTSDDYEEAIALANEPRDACVGCISPAVRVACEGGACVGVEIEDVESAEYRANAGDHCGAATGERTDALSSGGQETPPPGRVFGCGVDE